ncbi:MAG: ribosome maturation factor RimM [Oscillospiraceae bacterium]|nr:ribosome maturation factor RimM [Oscillospiraceae bacterium]
MKSGLIETGKIVNTHGIRGELRLQPWADTPAFLTGFEYFYIDEKPVRVLSSKVHKSFVIVSLEGVDNIDTATRMKNKIVCVKRENIKLEDGNYLIADLIGLSAIDAKTDKKLGTVSDVLPLPAHNVYVINGEREILVPAVPEFIAETNLSEGYIKFNIIEGL